MDEIQLDQSPLKCQHISADAVKSVGKSVEKIISREPDLNQRPKDLCVSHDHYSPPLYQLSYRG